jgi:hypothetical protein
MKKLIAIALSAGIIASIPLLALAAGKGATPNGKPFIEIAGQIVEVEGQIASIQDQVDSLVARVDTIEERVGANENAVINLTTTNEELQALMDSYGLDVTVLKEKVQTLEEENIALKELVDYGDASQQTQIDANEAMITTLNLSIADLGDLQSQIGNNLVLIHAMQDEIIAINTLLDLKQDVVDGVCPEGSFIREIHVNGSVSCELDNATSANPSNISEVRTFNFAPSEIVVYNGVNYNGPAHAEATCPVGYSLTGGGFFNGPSTLNQSYPRYMSGTVNLNSVQGRTWASRNSSTEYSTYTYVFAICIGFL